jgi:hypothetical protein
MAYNNNIPQATDQLSQSQADLLANFQAIQVLVDINHVDFASSDQGKHKWVTWPVQGSAPSFLSGEVGAYNLLSSVTSINELYLNKLVAGSTAIQVPMTASILSTNAAPASMSGYWTYFPSGIIQLSGVGNSTGLVTVTFGGATIPALTQILNISVEPYNNGSGIDSNLAVTLDSVVSTTSFKIYISPRTTTGPATGSFRWTVVGY